MHFALIRCGFIFSLRRKTYSTQITRSVLACLLSSLVGIYYFRQRVFISWTLHFIVCELRCSILFHFSINTFFLQKINTLGIKNKTGKLIFVRICDIISQIAISESTIDPCNHSFYPWSINCRTSFQNLLQFHSLQPVSRQQAYHQSDGWGYLWNALSSSSPQKTKQNKTKQNKTKQNKNKKQKTCSLKHP